MHACSAKNHGGSKKTFEGEAFIGMPLGKGNRNDKMHNESMRCWHAEVVKLVVGQRNREIAGCMLSSKNSEKRKVIMNPRGSLKQAIRAFRVARVEPQENSIQGYYEENNGETPLLDVVMALFPCIKLEAKAINKRCTPLPQFRPLRRNYRTFARESMIINIPVWILLSPDPTGLSTHSRLAW